MVDNNFMDAYKIEDWAVDEYRVEHKDLYKVVLQD
jgi:hypothetical protein